MNNILFFHIVFYLWINIAPLLTIFFLISEMFQEVLLCYCNMHCNNNLWVLIVPNANIFLHVCTLIMKYILYYL